MLFNRKWDLAFDGQVSCIDISQEGQCSLIGTKEGDVLFLSPDRQLLWQVSRPNPILDVKSSPGGEWNVVLEEGNIVSVFSRTGEPAWERKMQSAADVMEIRPKSDLIFVGNRYHNYYQLTIHGKPVRRGTVGHSIDFIRFAPFGDACAVGSEDGRITLLGYDGVALWSIFTHRMILGIDVAERASFIIVPSVSQGIVALEANGTASGVYEVRNSLVAAECDDDGQMIVALDVDGNLILLDRQAKCHSITSTGFRAEMMALDSRGQALIVSGLIEPGRSGISMFLTGNGMPSGAQFLEVRKTEVERLPLGDNIMSYLEE